MVTTLSISADPSPGDRGVIAPEMFGIIQTGYHGFHGFDRQFAELGGRAVRWPGGMLSETDVRLYDLNDPDVFNAAYLYKFNPDRERPSLTDMLAWCVEKDLPFSMVIPTERYATRMATGEAEVRAFVTRLLSGTHGELPREVTLEIGNEYFDLDAFGDAPELYGSLASRLVTAIAEVLDDPALNPRGIDLRIAVQAGKFQTDDQAILAAFSDEALREVDELIVHALPISLENFRDPADNGGPDDGQSRIERMIDTTARWQDAIRLAGGTQELDLNVSAWTVGTSASDVFKVDLTYQDIGFRAASTMLDMFAGFSVAGVDAAAAWGVHVENLNTFSHIDSDNSIDVTPSGAMFDLMSANLVGTAFVSEYGLHDRGDAFMTYYFSGAERAVIYVAANDIDNAGESVLLHLPQDRDYRLVDATSLEGERPAHQGALERYFERAVVTPIEVAAEGETLLIPFSRDYQVVQVVLEVVPGTAPAPDPGETPVTGGAGDEAAAAGAGDDAPAGDLASAILTGGGEDAFIFVATGGSGTPNPAAGPDSDGSWAEPPPPADGSETAVPVAAAGVGSHLSGIFARLLADDDFRWKGPVPTPRGGGNDMVAGGTVPLRSPETPDSSPAADLVPATASAGTTPGLGGAEAVFVRGGLDLLFGGRGRDLRFGASDRLRDIFRPEPPDDSRAASTGRDAISSVEDRTETVGLRATDAGFRKSGDLTFRLAGAREAPETVWRTDTFRDLPVRGDPDGDATGDFDIDAPEIPHFPWWDFLG